MRSSDVASRTTALGGPIENGAYSSIRGVFPFHRMFDDYVKCYAVRMYGTK